MAATGPMPMMRGSTPATAVPTTRARGFRPKRLIARSEASKQCAGSVVHTRRVAGRYRAAAAKRGRQLRERLQARLARVLVEHHHRGLAALRGNGDADDLRGEVARLLRGERALLAAQRELVLVLARDAKIVGDVLAGLRHRIDAVRLLEERIHEAPADGRIVQLHVAREGRRALRQHVRARGSCSRRRRRAAPRPRRNGLFARALATASSPDPHSRLSVAPGTSTGSPASSALMRATLRLSSPA